MTSVSFVIPCLNERDTIGTVVSRCIYVAARNQWRYEVIVADNGSTDGSREIAESVGAHVIAVHQKGYGAALQGGIESAAGDFVVMGDGDGTYDFIDCEEMVARLEHGADLVIGNRFKGGISKGAMPFLHRYVGNPLLSLIGRIFFGIKASDFHCGIRAFRSTVYSKCNLQSTGMEFASEMLIKAALYGLNIEETKASLRPGYQGRKPHLRTWRDGWRHLRFMLSFSPRYAFLVSSWLFAFGSVILLFLYCFDVEPLSGPSTLLVSSFAAILGIRLTSDYAYSKTALNLFIASPGPDANVLSPGLMNRDYLIKQTNRKVDCIYRLFALVALAGIAVVSQGLNPLLSGDASTKIDHIQIYFGSIIIFASVEIYSLACKLSMLCCYKEFRNK